MSTSFFLTVKLDDSGRGLERDVTWVVKHALQGVEEPRRRGFPLDLNCPWKKERALGELVKELRQWERQWKHSADWGMIVNHSVWARLLAWLGRVQRVFGSEVRVWWTDDCVFDGVMEWRMDRLADRQKHWRKVMQSQVAEIGRAVIEEYRARPKLQAWLDEGKGANP